MSDFLFPDVGEGIHEGKIVSWKIKEGDNIQADQVLAEVETDKAIVEIPSPQTGTITKLHKKEGEVIKVGEPLVTFGGEAQQTPPQRPQEQGTKKVESTLTPSPPTPEQHEPTPQPVHEAEQGPTHEQPSRILASPSTRKYAREKGVDLNNMQGTGEHGRITRQDVEKATAITREPEKGTAKVESNLIPTPPTPEQHKQPPQPVHEVTQPPSTGDNIPYTGRRKAIGEKMLEAHTYPTATHFADADVTELAEIRDHLKGKAEEHGVKLSFLPFIAIATISALRKHPIMNSTLTTQGIQQLHDIHLGIATDTPKGLVVPVIKKAQEKSVLELAREINTMAAAAREDKLSLDNTRGSTFTISNIGRSKVSSFTSLINTPEAAILGVGAIQERPWMVEGQVQPRKVLTLAVNYDHRIMDGAEAGRFLTDIVNMLEDPELLVLEGI